MISYIATAMALLKHEAVKAELARLGMPECELQWLAWAQRVAEEPLRFARRRLRQL